MRKLILTAVALMCSGLWAVAQSSSTPDTSSSPSGQSASSPSSSSSSSGMSGSQSATSPSSSASSSGSTTVDGCLAGSAGNYTLKDKATGTTYTLSGPTSALAAHVGHELQVTGTTSGSSAASSSGSASSSASSPSSSTSSTPSSASGAGGSQTLNVTSAKMVSSSCSAQ